MGIDKKKLESYLQRLTKKAGELYTVLSDILMSVSTLESESGNVDTFIYETAKTWWVSQEKEAMTSLDEADSHQSKYKELRDEVEVALVDNNMRLDKKVDFVYAALHTCFEDIVKSECQKYAKALFEKTLTNGELVDLLRKGALYRAGELKRDPSPLLFYNNLPLSCVRIFLSEGDQESVLWKLIHCIVQTLKLQHSFVYLKTVEREAKSGLLEQIEKLLTLVPLTIVELRKVLSDKFGEQCAQLEVFGSDISSIGEVCSGKSVKKNFKRRNGMRRLSTYSAEREALSAHLSSSAEKLLISTKLIALISDLFPTMAMQTTEEQKAEQKEHIGSMKQGLQRMKDVLTQDYEAYGSYTRIREQFLKERETQVDLFSAYGSAMPWIMRQPSVDIEKMGVDPEKERVVIEQKTEELEATLNVLKKEFDECGGDCEYFLASEMAGKIKVGWQKCFLERRRQQKDIEDYETLTATAVNSFGKGVVTPLYDFVNTSGVRSLCGKIEESARKLREATYKKHCPNLFVLLERNLDIESSDEVMKTDYGFCRLEKVEEVTWLLVEMAYRRTQEFVNAVNNEVMSDAAMLRRSLLEGTPPIKEIDGQSKADKVLLHHQMLENTYRQLQFSLYFLCQYMREQFEDESKVQETLSQIEAIRTEIKTHMVTVRDSLSVDSDGEMSLKSEDSPKTPRTPQGTSSPLARKLVAVFGFRDRSHSTNGVGSSLPSP